MEIRAVGIADIIAAGELLKEYAEECSLPEVGEINPQQEMYATMQALGVNKFFAAYEGLNLIGFASVLTAVLPHYSRKVATIESIFVAKEHRSTDAGRALMHTVEHHAKEQGCGAILYSAPAGGKLERLLTVKGGYRHSNTVFVKAL